MSCNADRKRSPGEIIAKQQAYGGRQAAINANCVGCVYDPEEPGTWRQQVDQCGVESCPLYSFRPRSSSPRTSPTD